MVNGPEREAEARRLRGLEYIRALRDTLRPPAPEPARPPEPAEVDW